MLDWDALSAAELEEMAEAGRQVLNCYRVLAKSSDNIIGEVIKGHGTFYEMDHYPPGDIFDPESHSQYYYHSHRGGEHGHFHTFIRSDGMLETIKPIKDQSHQDFMDERDDDLTHLIGISMDAKGFPLKLFTTNRWVTAENWYTAEDVISLIDQFEIDLVPPSWPVNVWMTGFIQLFKPVIKTLILERDETIAAWAEKYPERDVFEDRELEITSAATLDVEAYLQNIQARLPQE
ncbi:MAG: hypothetical protein JKX94_12795 [Sneathiella sp.]|nr:hypothetical protein [Sneathiella sp.]